MKKYKIIPILALFALPLFSCKTDLSPSVAETPSSNADVSSSDTDASSNGSSSDSSVPPSTGESSEDSSTPTQGDSHATGLSVSLFEKMPKVPSSTDTKIADVCIFYPASEFDLGVTVTPNNALEKNIVVTIPEEHKDEISYENGKLITKNVYSTAPFEIVVSIEGTNISLTQKVGVVPGGQFLAAKLNDHLVATDEGEEKCATSASYGVFYGPEKTDGTAPNNSMDIAYFTNETIATTFENGKCIAKNTNRIEDGYYYNVNFKEDGTTIDFDSSSKTPIGDGKNQISSEEAAYQVNRISYVNNRYGFAEIMTDLLPQYEFLDGREPFKETLRFDILEDSDTRFSADIVGNKPYVNENVTKPFYTNAKIDVLFDSAKRITSFKLFFAFSDQEVEDPTNITITPTEKNSGTYFIKINYADRKTPNPSQDDFSRVELEKPASEKVKSKFEEIAEQLDKAEGEKLSSSRLHISFPNVYEETNEARYYKNETILDSSLVVHSGETTSKSQSRTATTIRDDKLYSLSYNFENNKYTVISSSEIGTAEGQTSEADAIYQANHAHFNQNAIGLKGAFETYFMMGLNDEETLGEVTYQNIKTEIISNYDYRFECSIYFSISTSNAGTTETSWAAATASIGFSSGDINYANLNIDIYTSNPFDSHGDLNKEVTPARTETIEMTLSYYADNTKIDNPNPITFSESEPESPSDTSETVAERMSQIVTDLNIAEATRAKNATFKMSVTELGEQESQTVCDEELKINYYKDETIVSDTSNSYSGNETSTYSEETVTTIRDGYLYKLKYDFKNNTYNLTSKTEIGNDKEAQSEAISEANHAKNPVSGTNLLDDFFEQCFALGLVNQTIPNVGDFQNIQTTILKDSATPLSFTCNYVVIDSSGGTTSEAWFASTVNLSFEPSKDSGDYLLVGVTLERYMFTTNPFDDNGEILQNVTPNYRENYSLNIEYYETDEKEENPKPIDVTELA